MAASNFSSMNRVSAVLARSLMRASSSAPQAAMLKSLSSVNCRSTKSRSFSRACSRANAICSARNGGTISSAVGPVSALGGGSAARLFGVGGVGVATRSGSPITTNASAPPSRTITAVNTSARSERRRNGPRRSPPAMPRPRPPAAGQRRGDGLDVGWFLSRHRARRRRGSRHSLALGPLGPLALGPLGPSALGPLGPYARRPHPRWGAPSRVPRSRCV